MRTDCPSSETLAAAAGADAGKADADVVAHLSTCDDCAEEFRLARSLEPWAAGAAARLKTPATVRQVLPSWWGALAAGLAVVSVGLGGSYMRLRSERAEVELRLATERDQASQRVGVIQQQLDALRKDYGALSVPQPNAPIVELRPQTTVRGAEASSEVSVPPNTTALVLVIHVWSSAASTDYGVEIVDAGGKKVWEGRGLQRNANGDVTLVLPTRLLPAGTYNVGLSSVGPKGSTLLQASALRVIYH